MGSGWYVLLADHDFGFVEGGARSVVIAALGGEAVACGVEEHRMAARAWRDGKVTWSVVYDGSEGIQTTGEPPPTFEELRSTAISQSTAEGEDPDLIFDVPVDDLAEQLTGHDCLDVKFDVLESIATPVSAGFFAKRFGRRGLPGPCGDLHPESRAGPLSYANNSSRSSFVSAPAD